MNDETLAKARTRLRRWYMGTTALRNPWVGDGWFVRGLYSVWSKFYDSSTALDPAYRDNARRMVEAVVRERDRVLDVGMGTGMLAEFAAPRAAAYVGLDYSGAMLAVAARKIAARKSANVTLQWGDARSLPFADDAFDAVVSSFVLPHFLGDEKARVLREMVRVLKPGGRLGLFLAQGEIFPVFTPRPELEALLLAAGLTDIQVEDRADIYRTVSARK